jgi:hypothetical protein
MAENPGFPVGAAAAGGHKLAGPDILRVGKWYTIMGG